MRRPEWSEEENSDRRQPPKLDSLGKNYWVAFLSAMIEIASYDTTVALIEGPVEKRLRIKCEGDKPDSLTVFLV